MISQQNRGWRQPLESAMAQSWRLFSKVVAGGRLPPIRRPLRRGCVIYPARALRRFGPRDQSLSFDLVVYQISLAPYPPERLEEK